MKKSKVIAVSLVFIIIAVLFAVYGFGDTASGYVSGFQGTCATNANCLSPRRCISRICGCISSDCRSPEKCNAVNGRCELSSYGGVCTTNSECISRLCVPNTLGRGKICGCSATNGCGATEYCDTEGTCRLGSPPSALDRLVAEINVLIANMNARVARLEGRL